MPQQQGPREPHYSCRVLLIAADSLLRPLISTFLSTMHCAYVVVSSAQQLAASKRQSFDAALIDMANSEMPVEQTIVSLRELHPSVSERILAFSSRGIHTEMVEAIERYGLYQISRETLLPQIWATLQDLVAGTRISRPPSMELAQLMFDSFLSPSHSGVRSSHESARHVAYRCKDKIVDILITPHVRSNRVSLAGQVTDMGTRGKDNDSLTVLLMDGTRIQARTTTNQYGEFELEFEILEDPGLQIRLLEGSWAAIALGTMDWAKTRPVD